MDCVVVNFIHLGIRANQLCCKPTSFRSDVFVYFTRKEFYENQFCRTIFLLSNRHTIYMSKSERKQIRMLNEEGRQQWRRTVSCCGLFYPSRHYNFRQINFAVHVGLGFRSEVLSDTPFRPFEWNRLKAKMRIGLVDNEFTQQIWLLVSVWRRCHFHRLAFHVTLSLITALAVRINGSVRALYKTTVLD